MKKKQEVPYILKIVANKWVGNFERELVGYAMGCLDSVQMDIDYAYEQRAMFWKEVFNEDSPREDFEGYDLMENYLLETYQDVDDWEQMTFYNVSGIEPKKNGDFISAIKIQLEKPLNEYWESIIIPRIKKFFDENIDGYHAELLSLQLLDKKENTIKDYLEQECLDNNITMDV